MIDLKKISKRMWVASIAVLLLAVALGVFKLSKNRTPITTVVELHFHPDAVQELRWQIDGQNFVYRRDSRDAQWEPEIAPNVIQRKLIALATTGVTPMSAPREGLKIELVFGPDNSWRGIYDDGRFVWTTGLKAGQGFDADHNLRAAFESGQWAFRELSYDWCKARPAEIDIELPNIEFTLSIAADGVRATDKETKKVTTVDATTFETWLSRNCKLEVHNFWDLQHYPDLDQDKVGEVAIKFNDGSVLELQKDGPYWTFAKDLAIRSPQFDEALSFLSVLARIK